MSPLSIAAAGMSTAVTRFNRASKELVESFQSKEGASPETSIADQIEAKAQFKANAAVARMADEMLGALIDIKA
ncbi:MAG: flagellar basal body rod C-terminal domain-containing protein [Caulobacterales bacterium]